MAAKSGKRAGAWVVMILLFVGLIGFGSANLSGNVRSIGKAGEMDIPVQSYATALQQQLSAFSAQIGQPLSFPQAQALGLDQAVLQQVVASRVLDNEAAAMGLSVGDARVAERVREIPAFGGISGQFDREAYRFTLERNGLSEAEFEASLREEMARSLLQAAVLSGIPAPEAYADVIAAFVGERRSFSWATVTDAALETAIPAPTEAEIVAQYEANPEAYTAPERRRVTYAAILPDMILDEVEVDETAVRELYDQRIDEFVQPERRLVERLVFSGTEPAEAALAAIAAGETDFDTLVTDRGLRLSDIDLGDVAKESLGAAGDAVFAAAPGDVVGPFESPLGPALFRMNAVLAAEEISFDEAGADLRDELARDRARRVIEAERAAIEDLLAGGASLEDLAERTILETGTLDWAEGESDGLAAYEEVRTALAAAEIGAFPEIETLSDGGLFLVRLEEVVPPTLIPLDEVRTRVAADRAAAARIEALDAAAEALAARISAGESFGEAGLSAFAEENVIRRNFISGAPEGLTAAVFDMDVGETRVVRDGQGLVAIVRLDAVAPADLTDETVATERAAALEQAGQAIAQDLYGAYSASVQLRTEVRIDEAAVAAVHGSFQ